MLPQEQLPPPSSTQLRDIAAALLEDAQKRLPQQQEGSGDAGDRPAAAAAAPGSSKQRTVAARISARADPQVLKEGGCHRTSSTALLAGACRPQPAHAAWSPTVCDLGCAWCVQPAAFAQCPATTPPHC
jgi:hypothetical protein